MSFLLDTCVISELVKTAPDAGVVAWIHDQEESELFLSVLTLGELQKGIAKLPEGSRRSRLEAWVRSDLLIRFGRRILDVDQRTAVLWGTRQGEAERNGRPIPVIDGLIGASALANGCTVVSRNTADIERTGADVFNPWQ